MPLASGQVDAIVAWQPNSGSALSLVPGSKAVFTSADQPGLIYDVLAVTPESLANRRADWLKVMKVWYRIVDYIKDTKTFDAAVKIMASRVGVPAEQYKTFISGTRILTLDEVKELAGKADGYGSLYGSSKISDDFNIANKVYDKPQDIDTYIDLSLMEEL